MKQEYEETQFKQSIEDLYVELPQCNISSDAMFPKRVQRIVAREKSLEETIEKMKAEHEACIEEIEVECKDRIVDLDTKAPRMPPMEHEAQVVKLEGCGETIDSRLVEMQELLNEATHTWTTMEEIDGLVEVHTLLQKNQQKFDELIVTRKDFFALECMMEMKESTKLQTKMQKLQAKEVEFMQTLQPWQEQVSEIIVQINVKLIEFKVMQTIVVILLDEQPTTKLITATRESVVQMTQELVALTTSYTKINIEIWNAMKLPKDDEGGSVMSHK